MTTKCGIPFGKVVKCECWPCKLVSKADNPKGINVSSLVNTHSKFLLPFDPGTIAF